MKRTQSDGNYRTEFENYGEFLALCEQELPPFEESRRCAPSERWDLNCGFAGALKLARDGWPEGRKTISEISEKLDSLVGETIRKADIQWEVTGDFVDIGRYLTGEPECMGQFTEIELPSTGKIVRVMVNLSASAGIDSHDMVKRGAAAVALIDALESCGRQCELFIVSAQTSTYGNGTHETIVPVKRAGEHMELDRLAFTLAHPANYRRLFFAAWEHESSALRDNIGYRRHSNYGNPDRASAFDKECNVIVPHMLWHGNNEATLQWVYSELKKQGIETEAIA